MTSDFGYEFESLEHGFIVSAPSDRTPVQVTLQPWAWVVAPYQGGGYANRLVGLVRTRYLVDTIAHKLRMDWKPRDGKIPHRRVQEWAVGRTARAIHKRTMVEVERLLVHVPQEVLDVQRAVFAATFATGPASQPELYEPQYAMLRSDIKRYRAAAMALNMSRELVRDSAQRQIRNAPDFKALEARASELGLQMSVSEKPWTPGNPHRLSTNQVLDSLADDWKALFSPDGRPYTSLNRTLMNIPGGVPASLLTHLAGVRLPRPVTDRVELLGLLTARQSVGQREERRRHFEVFVHASREQVTKAMRMVADTTAQPLSPRRTADIHRFVGYVMDYPEDHRGTVVGLARRSIRWHREEQQQEIQNTIWKLGNQPSVAPPIPPPDEVEFLGDVHRIAEEGQRMGHCVAAYAAAAVYGRSYLFHVSYRGEEATVEVSPFGHVTQTQGPGNHDNRACRYGRRVLNRWGSEFPAEMCNPTQAAGDPWAYPAVEQPF